MERAAQIISPLSIRSWVVVSAVVASASVLVPSIARDEAAMVTPRFEDPPRTLSRYRVSQRDTLATPRARSLQAAATRDGFVLLERTPLQRIIPVARDGVGGDSIHLPRLPVDARAIGLKSGDTALVYQAGRYVQIDAVGNDGELRKLADFGTRVHGLCEGMGTNEHRFAVAWTEVNGSVWMVHGPTGAAMQAVTAEVSPAEDTAPPKQPAYCGAAAAGTQIVLLWQDGMNVNLNTCDARRCRHAATFKLTGGRRVESFGCTWKSCAIAARTPDGATDLGWVGANGKLKWAKRIEVAPGSQLSIVGAGQDHIVVGHMRADREAALTIADESGRIATVWNGQADTAPYLVWSRDRLLFARHVDGHIAVGMLMKRDGAFVEDSGFGR